MPSTPLYDRTGKTVGDVQLSDELFAAPVNAAVLHQVVTAQLAGRRLGTHDTKTRAEVRGGGRKPYRQKGTGRARQGSLSAPHYRGGGAVFGPHPRSYEQRLPRKMKRLALRGALTAKLDDAQLKVIDGFGLDAIKTRELASVLTALDATGRVLVVAPGRDRTRELSAPNHPRGEVILAD
jgi:large subunit ribosomal protein L4